jgi:hypothetical protein
MFANVLFSLQSQVGRIVESFPQHRTVSGMRSSRTAGVALIVVAILAACVALLAVSPFGTENVDHTECVTSVWKPNAPEVGADLLGRTVISVDIVSRDAFGNPNATVCTVAANTSVK